MKLHCRLMGLCADLKYESEGERVSVEWDGLVFPAMYQQMRDLIMSFRRLHETDKLDKFKIECLHSGGRGRKLPLAAIDENNLRQWFFFSDQSLVSTIDGFVHRCEV